MIIINLFGRIMFTGLFVDNLIFTSVLFSANSGHSWNIASGSCHNSFVNVLPELKSKDMESSSLGIKFTGIKKVSKHRSMHIDAKFVGSSIDGGSSYVTKLNDVNYESEIYQIGFRYIFKFGSAQISTSIFSILTV